MKKFISLTLSIMLLFSYTSIVLASTSVNLTEDEYLKAVSEIMVNYYDDVPAAQEALADLDTTLLQEPKVTNYSVNGEISTYGINPSDYSLSVYSFNRAGQNRHYLQWSLDSNRTEVFAGPLDYVSMEWDTAYASYYSSNGDTSISTVNGKNTGIVLFNVQDNKLKSGTYTYGTVQVTPNGKSGWLEFGSKYVHTYTTLDVSGSASFEYKPSGSLSSSDFSLGISYIFGFTVNVGTNTSKWQIWNDNAVKL